MTKAKKPNPSSYLMVDWDRSYTSEYLQGVVDMCLYKGKVLLNVRDTTERAKALAKHAGIHVAGTAWMRVEDIDAIMRLLRDAKKLLRMHDKDAHKIVACKACRKIFAGACDRHKKLFDKYRTPKAPRRLPIASAR